jgi:hypothetical protein
MKRTSHPSFSPDLGPSNFYLFGKLKSALIREKFGEECELLDGVMRVLDAITHEGLEAILDEWLVRLDEPITQGYISPISLLSADAP